MSSGSGTESPAGGLLHRDTQVTRLGRDPASHLQTINPPVYRASTILFPTLADLEAQWRGEYHGLVYGLEGTPTTHHLEAAVAALEGGHAGRVMPSGLAAIAVPLLALLAPGDHLLVTDAVYEPARRFCQRQLERLGIEVEYYEPSLGAEVARLFRPRTRVVLCESPGSLSFEVQDVRAIAAAARAHGVWTLLDNTWATPLGFRAFAHGVDVSIHAGTKYLGGHSDLVLGVVVCNEASLRAIDATRSDLGLTAGPDDCYLALRGLRTLALRLERQAASALAVARWLAGRAEVLSVLHPPLPGAPGHALWQRDFTGAGSLFGVILAPGPRAALAAMLDGFRLFRLGYSWGGFESLAMVYPERRLRRGVVGPASGGTYLRLYVGLEHPEDLIADLDAGLVRYRAAGGAAGDPARG